MAIPWLVVLQSVPWRDVIRNAPKVADGARKLWGAVSKKAPTQELPTQSSEPPLHESRAIVLLQARLAAMEVAIAELHSQMLASSELIKTLAEQNTQLIERIETSRIRVIWLAGATGAFGIIAVVSLGLRLMQ
jgi:hypothetical protein